MAGASILVAEDNTINQRVVMEFLKMSGMRAVVANNGAEALEILAGQDFDAILMDVHMPVMNGIDAAGRIRENPLFQTLPILALTAGVTEEERNNCLMQGMNDFIAKPVVPEQLISILLKWLPPLPPEPGVEANVLRNLTGFNYQRLHCLEITMGGADKVAAAILDFLKRYRAIDGELNGWRGENAGEPALAKLHAMKLIAIELGARQLALLINDLENALRQNIWPEDKIREFAAAWRVVYAEGMDKLAGKIVAG